MAKKYELIQIADEEPESAEEQMIQMGFALANLFNEVEQMLLLEGKVHPLAATMPVDSPIITMRGNGKKRIQVVGVTLPIATFQKIKATALEIVAQRLIEEGQRLIKDGETGG